MKLTIYYCPDHEQSVGELDGKQVCNNQKTMSQPLVKVISGKYYDTVMWWCPICQETHSFAAYHQTGPYASTVPIAAGNVTLWYWNGNPLCPNVDDQCIIVELRTTVPPTSRYYREFNSEQLRRINTCHTFIRNGKLWIAAWDNALGDYRRRDNVSMKPVSEWPFRPPGSKK